MCVCSGTLTYLLFFFSCHTRGSSLPWDARLLTCPDHLIVVDMCRYCCLLLS